MSHTQLKLFKENFKFSAAHFLIFDQHRAEKLHGHNYRVELSLDFTKELPESGFFVDFKVIKDLLKQRLDQWDEHLLLPGAHPEMKISENGNNLDVRFRERFYSFPADEVRILPLTNTSVEGLSKLLCEELAKEARTWGVSRLSVFVEETRGQGAQSSLEIL